VQVYIGYAEMDISLMVSDEDFYARSLDVKRIGLNISEGGMAILQIACDIW